MIYIRYLVIGTTETLINVSQSRFLNEVEGSPLPFERSYSLSASAAAHVAVVDKEDTYVSVVTSLNTWFGSKVRLNRATSSFHHPDTPYVCR